MERKTLLLVMTQLNSTPKTLPLDVP